MKRRKDNFEERMVMSRVMRLSGLRLAFPYFLVYFPISTVTKSIKNYWYKDSGLKIFLNKTQTIKTKFEKALKLFLVLEAHAVPI